MFGPTVTVQPSEDPFPVGLRDLMETQELTFRRLAERTAVHRPGGKPYAINLFTLLLNGQSRPTPENMEVIAAAAGVEPTYFLEYRQHLASERARALVREVGMDKVMKALDRLDPARRQTR